MNLIEAISYYSVPFLCVVLVYEHHISIPQYQSHLINTIMTTCIRCADMHIRCQLLDGCSSCRRCAKYHFPCLFPHSPPSPPRPTPPPPPPPSFTTQALPTWTHHFVADTNSSNRVRAASIAFVASDSHADLQTKARLIDRVRKKFAKQEKYLQLPSNIVDSTHWISAETIKNEVVVFDGTASYPPPPIAPPSNVSIVIHILFLNLSRPF